MYKITNLVNSKIYVGVHKTTNLEDGYMGSGKVIRNAIAKHGIENFKKDILEFFENAELMYAREKEVVNENFLLRKDVYNLRRGGSGGFDYINKLGLNPYTTTFKNPDVHKATIESRKLRLLEKGFTDKELKSHKKLKGVAINKSFRDKGCINAASESSKLKRNNTFDEIKHQQGEKNSQFGTIWITNGFINKKIKKEDSIPEGWNRGRT